MKALLLGGFALVLSYGCVAQRNDNPEFFLSTQKKRLAVIHEAAGFQPGDTVVDIGSGNGWMDAALGIHQDSVTFFLEELDSTYIRNGRLKEALGVYEQVRGKPISCGYNIIVGTKTGTNLPDAFCHRILLIDTYHHLACRDEMIRDMKRILKNDGKLIVYELLARKPKEILKACKTEIYTQDHIISSFESNGLHLDGIYRTVNNNRKKVRVFTFSKR